MNAHRVTAKKLMLILPLAALLAGCTLSEAEILYNKAVWPHVKPTNKIFYYTEAIKLKPDFAAAYNNRGRAYLKAGLLDKAIADETRAIELKPDFHNAHFNRGLVYEAKGQFDVAIRNYNEALRIKPDYVMALIHRAGLYDKKNHTAKAIADATETIRIL